VHERTQEPMNGFDTAGVWIKYVDHFISFSWIILTNTVWTYIICDTH